MDLIKKSGPLFIWNLGRLTRITVVYNYLIKKNKIRFFNYLFGYMNFISDLLSRILYPQTNNCRTLIFSSVPLIAETVMLSGWQWRLQDHLRCCWVSSGSSWRSNRFPLFQQQTSIWEAPPCFCAPIGFLSPARSPSQSFWSVDSDWSLGPET